MARRVESFRRRALGYQQYGANSDGFYGRNVSIPPVQGMRKRSVARRQLGRGCSSTAVPRTATLAEAVGGPNGRYLAVSMCSLGDDHRRLTLQSGLSQVWSQCFLRVTSVVHKDRLSSLSLHTPPARLPCLSSDKGLFSPSIQGSP